MGRPVEREGADSQGPAGLTGREREVMSLVADRLTNAEIAEALFISQRTVESHVSSLLRKFGVTRRGDLIAVWWTGEHRVAGSASTPAATVPEPLYRLLTGAFVGRADELLCLHEAFARARARRPQLVLVSGETGIGKSRLLAEFAASLGPGVATVRLGRCDDQPGPPYQPIAEILRTDAKDRSDDELERLVVVGHDATHLGALVPDLGDRLSRRPPENTSLDDASDRHAMFEAVRQYLSAVAEQRPLVLMLEDVHWADHGVLALVRHLARNLGSTAVLMLFSARFDNASRGWVRWLSELRRAPEFTEVELGALSRDAVASLARASACTPVDELGDWLHQRGGGNPFFTLELLRTLERVENGHCDRDDAPNRQRALVPPAVLDLVHDRLWQLPEPTQRLLEWAAVIGTDFDVDALAATQATDAGRIVDGLVAAERAGVIRPQHDRPGRFEFTHVLVRDASVERLPVTRRMQMHAAIALALLPRHRPDDAATTVALAHHLVAAGPLGDRRLCAGYSRQAGDIARRAHADDDAARHYERALDALLHISERDAGEECALRIRLGEAQRRAGDPRHRDTLLAAADLGVQIERRELVADAVLALIPGGWSSLVGRPDPEVVRLAEHALAGLEPSDASRRVRLTAVLAADATMRGDQTRARELAARAVDDARRRGDLRLVAFALLRSYWARWDPDDVDIRRHILDEAVELGRALGDAELTVYAHACRFDALMESGDLDSAIASLDVVERHAGDVHQALYRWLGPQKRSGLAQLRGDFALAERLGDDALRVGRSASNPVVHATWAAQRCLIRLEQGRAAEVVDVAAQCADQLPAFPAWRALLSVLLWNAGRADEARRVYQAVVGEDVRRHPRINTWRSEMHCVATMAISLGDRKVAGHVYDALVPSRGALDWHGGGSFGPSDLVLGRLAGFLGDEEASRTHLEASVATCRRIAARAYLVHALDALSNTPIGREAADALRREAKELAAAIGMQQPV